jgi:uncharacterized membrane protein YhhN
MKWILGIAAVFMVLGAWAGFRADASIDARFQTGLAVFLACHLLFCIAVWYHTEPGSGDRLVLPTVMLTSAAMLIGILPRLFWPGAERLHIAAWIVGLGVMAVALIRQVRRRKQLRPSGPTL